MRVACASRAEWSLALSTIARQIPLENLARRPQRHAGHELDVGGALVGCQGCAYMRPDDFAETLLRSFGLARLNVGDDGFVPPSPAGSPTTAACSTAGWLAMAPSTSAGYTLKPERMILLITSPTYLIGNCQIR